MQKFLKLSIRLGIVLAIALLALPALAQATIVVDNTSSSAGCNLREAIETANNDNAGSTGCTLESGTLTAGGADTIVFDDTFFSSGTGRVEMGNTQTITSNITIDGIFKNTDSAGDKAKNLTIRPPTGDRDRLFEISSGGTLTLQGVTVGWVNTNSGEGAIKVEGGNLTTARSNRHPTLQATSATARYVQFTSHSAATLGGAIWVDHASSTVTINDAWFIGNFAGNGGGAIAIGSTGGTVNINRTVFLENESTGASAANAEGGAAILVKGGTLTVDNSVFYDDVVDNDKGVIQVEGGSATLRHVIIANDDGDAADTGLYGAGGTTTLSNSIITNITNGDGDATSCEGTVGGSGNLIDGTNNCGATTTSTADPDLTLNEITGIFSPSATSPVIDAVACLTTVTAAGSDFVGTSRPQDAKGDGDSGTDCDIGPLEVISIPQNDSTIYVDTADDNTTQDGFCSLREAIENINNTNRGNIDCEVGGTLTATIDLYVNLNIMLSSSLPEIDDGATNTVTSLTINGNGATIDGQNLHSLLNIRGVTNATLNQVTLQNARKSTGAGAAMATTGEGITIRNSAFLNNTAVGINGGAISTGGADITVDNVIFSGNSATGTGKGGAIYLNHSSSAANAMTIRNSTFINNSVEDKGGAIASISNSLTITNTTFSGNSTSTSQLSTGIAIFLSGNNQNPNLAHTLTHVTFANNTAPNAASGSAALVLLGDADATIQNSLFSGNDIQGCEFDGTGTYTGSGNLYHDGHTGCPGADVSGDPLLQPLSGVGYARAHDLGAGSSAINAVSCIAGITDDQRNADRPFPAGGQCDVGAVEDGSPIPTPEVTEDPSFSDPDNPNSRITPTAEPTDEPDDGGGDDMMDDDDDGDDGDDGDGAGSADTTRRRRAKATPTPAPTRTPVPTKPLGQVLNEQGYQITAATGMHSGVQFKVVDGAGVGNDAVIARGFIDAIDVFGWVSQGVTVCFKQLGAVVFLDADYSPRVPEDIASYATADGRTCVDLNRAGTLVLVHGSPTTAAMPAGTSGLQNCMVTLTDILNFRDGPGGDIMGILPAGVTLTALERTADWIKVDYHGAQGWISANYVTENGTCG